MKKYKDQLMSITRECTQSSRLMFQKMGTKLKQ